MEKKIFSKNKGQEDFKNPIISIVTPFFNAGEYIEETAKSVLEQTFQNFEWIIVDDGSSEEHIKKLKKIEKLDKRIKIPKRNIIQRFDRTCTNT